MVENVCFKPVKKSLKNVVGSFWNTHLNQLAKCRDKYIIEVYDTFESKPFPFQFHKPSPHQVPIDTHTHTLFPIFEGAINRDINDRSFLSPCSEWECTTRHVGWRKEGGHFYLHHPHPTQPKPVEDFSTSANQPAGAARPGVSSFLKGAVYFPYLD